MVLFEAVFSLLHFGMCRSNGAAAMSGPGGLGGDESRQTHKEKQMSYQAELLKQARHYFSKPPLRLITVLSDIIISFTRPANLDNILVAQFYQTYMLLCYHQMAVYAV